jgi:dihydroflavonol-4-reductase
MRALVTGASGLIGSHIVRALLGAGHDACAMVRPERSHHALDGLPATLIEGDVLVDDARLLTAVRGCDTVFHTAAQFSYALRSSRDLRDIAINGTANVLRACAAAHVRRVVVTSSSVVFGYREGDPTVLDENAPLCEDLDPAYAAAKVAQHRLAVAMAAELGLEVVLACPTMTLGRTSSTVGPSNGLIIAYLRDGLRCTYPGGCNIVSAEDVASGHMMLAEKGAPGESYILGAENLTWRKLHSMISDLVGVAGPRLQLNRAMGYLAAAVEEARDSFGGRASHASREQASMIGRYYWYSQHKAADLGYAPMPAWEALIEAVSWLVASPHIDREIRIGLKLSNDIYRFRERQSGMAPRGSVH